MDMGHGYMDMDMDMDIGRMWGCSVGLQPRHVGLQPPAHVGLQAHLFVRIARHALLQCTAPLLRFARRSRRPRLPQPTLQLPRLLLRRRPPRLRLRLSLPGEVQGHLCREQGGSAVGQLAPRRLL
jgi:hypothetical protein